MTAINLDAIPQELRDRPRWVVWRNKIPFVPSGEHAKSNDPKTWSTFEECVKVLPNFDGLGIMFADGLVGIDLDHHIDESGQLSDIGREIVRRIPTYWEISPSGTGLHGLCFGELPPGGRKSNAYQVEMYESGRYFTVTGQHWPGTSSTVERLNGEIADLHRWIFGDAKRATSQVSTQVQPLDLSDIDLLELATHAGNGAKFQALWRGDTSAYGGDESARDLALCNLLAFWTGRDAARIDRLFRQSDAYRAKWDQKHGADGRTYGAMTVDAAITSCREVYTPSHAQQAISEPPDMPDDWHTFDGPGSNDHTVDNVPPVSTTSTTTKSSDPLPLTDLGNARRLASKYGARLKYVDAWGPMYFTGTHWGRDDIGAWSRAAREVVRAIHLEAHAGLSDDRVKSILKWALSSQSRSRLESMLKLAESEPEIVTTPEIFDRDLMLLNCQNGTLDLSNGRLRPHNPQDHITRVVNADYNPSATCPIWLNFLDRIMRGNTGMIDYLQRAIGYSLTGLTIEQVLFLLWGTGANGKSVFLETLSALLGDYAQTAEFSTFLTRNVDTVRNDLAPLAGARFVAASEAGEGRRLSEVLVKSMTGGDLIKARYLFKEYFSFRPQFKLWLAANHKPIIRGTDVAIWRRVMLIPFTVTIPPDERDKRLAEKLRAELSGILAWAVEGCLSWQRDGLGTPNEVTEATASYRSDMDALGAFVEECCIVAPSAEVGAGELYAAYKGWAEQNGEHFENTRAFRQRMSDRGFSQARRNSGQVWFGIGLLTQNQGV